MSENSEKSQSPRLISLPFRALSSLPLASARGGRRSGRSSTASRTLRLGSLVVVVASLHPQAHTCDTTKRVKTFVRLTLARVGLHRLPLRPDTRVRQITQSDTAQLASTRVRWRVSFAVRSLPSLLRASFAIRNTTEDPTSFAPVFTTFECGCVSTHAWDSVSEGNWQRKDQHCLRWASRRATLSTGAAPRLPASSAEAPNASRAPLSPRTEVRYCNKKSARSSSNRAGGCSFFFPLAPRI